MLYNARFGLVGKISGYFYKWPGRKLDAHDIGPGQFAVEIMRETFFLRFFKVQMA